MSAQNKAGAVQSLPPSGPAKGLLQLYGPGSAVLPRNDLRILISGPPVLPPMITGARRCASAIGTTVRTITTKTRLSDLPRQAFAPMLQTEATQTGGVISGANAGLESGSD